MEYRELTHEVIAAAIEVHRELGPGFLEHVYEEALALELAEREIEFEKQKSIPVIYKDQRIGEHRLDFLVEGAVIVELKAVANLENIFFSTVRSYLKATNLQHGLLLNFASMPLTIRRVGREDYARIQN